MTLLPLATVLGIGFAGGLFVRAHWGHRQPRRRGFFFVGDEGDFAYRVEVVTPDMRIRVHLSMEAPERVVVGFAVGKLLALGFEREAMALDEAESRGLIEIEEVV